MCRLSVLYRLPLHEVARWPAADVSLLQAYLAKQPAPEERVEIQLASLRQTLRARWSDPAAVVPDLFEFLPYYRPWGDPDDEPEEGESRYSDVDKTFLLRL